MLGKLIKHEFKATTRLFVPIFLLSFAMALVLRLFMEIQDIPDFLEIFFVFLIIIFVVVLICVSMSGQILSFYRFYKSVYTDEGYLTNTLPVKPVTILSSKLIVAMVWSVLALIVFFVSIAVLIPWGSVNDALNEITIDAYGYAAGLSAIIAEMIDLTLNNIGTVIVFIILTLFGLFYNIATVYISVSIGNLVNRHKVAMAVAMYLIITNVLGFVISTIMTTISYLKNSLYNMDILEYNANGDLVFTSGFMGTMLIMIAILAVFSAAELLVTHFIMKNKLNLT